MMTLAGADIVWHIWANERRNIGAKTTVAHRRMRHRRSRRLLPGGARKSSAMTDHAATAGHRRAEDAQDIMDPRLRRDGFLRSSS